MGMAAISIVSIHHSNQGLKACNQKDATPTF